MKTIFYSNNIIKPLRQKGLMGAKEIEIRKPFEGTRKVDV